MSRSGPVLGALGRGGELVSGLGWTLFVMAIPVFVVVTSVLVGVIIRSRVQNDGDGARWASTEDGARGASVPEAARAERPILVLGAIIPTVVVALALAASVITLQRLPSAAQGGGKGQPDVLVIDVVGAQWWWSVTYPEHSVTTANELHLPVGRPVELRLTSTDVIHSFWVPRLGGKTDALPGDTNRLVLRAEEPGRYRGVCAEFCGLNHARMRMVAVAHDPADFERWLAAQQRPAVAPTTVEQIEGRDLFVSAGCAACHTIRSGTGLSPTAAPVGNTATDRRRGPDLTHLGSRDRIVGGALDNNGAELRRWIIDPAEFKEETVMPPAHLQGEQLDALLSYLESLA